MATDKIRENRLRRAAQRQELVLVKSRSRDPLAVDYGTYQLRDKSGKVILAGTVRGGFGLSLDQIETHLRGDTNG